MSNFLAAVRSRSEQILHSSIEEAHRSTLLAHLANASLRAGSKVSGSDLEREWGSVARTHEAIARSRSTLAAWGVDDRVEAWSVGSWLDVAPSGERFVAVSAGEATNRFLRRECRPGFVVPNEIRG
jgi:hypothetical protein